MEALQRRRHRGFQRGVGPVGVGMPSHPVELELNPDRPTFATRSRRSMRPWVAAKAGECISKSALRSVSSCVCVLVKGLL